MRNGTYKSEIWAHLDHPQEEYRYEVITRYWWNENTQQYDWHTAVIQIHHQGIVTAPITTANTPFEDSLAKHLYAIATRQPDRNGDPHHGRRQALDEHHEVLKLLAG